jgi:hypothetical protein
MQQFTTNLFTLNGAEPFNSMAMGEAILTLDAPTPTTRALRVQLAATGLEDLMDIGGIHVAHIHGQFAGNADRPLLEQGDGSFFDGAGGEPANSILPTLAASDLDGDGFLNFLEGRPNYGPVVLNLTSEQIESAPDGTPPLTHFLNLAGAGDINPAELFPSGSEFNLDTTYTFDLSDPDQLRQYNNLTPLPNREIVLHGLTIPTAVSEAIDTAAMGNAPPGLDLGNGEAFRITAPVAAGTIQPRFTGAAANTQLFALTDDNALVAFNPTSPEDAMSIPVTGINGTLLGIDTRPANGLIYGLTSANELYTLDPTGFANGDFGGSFTLTDAEQVLLEDGGLYINLHTQDFNGGELRGQVAVELEDDVVATGLVMSEVQQVGAVVPDGPATGMFDVIYDDATNALTISGSFSDLTSDLLPVGNTDAEGNPQSAIHLHNALAGANGPIVRNFTVDPSGSFFGDFILTEEEEALLLDDAFYVNLHTADFGSGELRGQVDIELENDIVASGIAIEESQQVGAVTPTDGPASGSFGIIYDDSTHQLTTEGTFSELTSPLLPVGAPDAEGNPQSAVHLHQGAAGQNGPIIRSLSTRDTVAEFVSTLSLPFEGGSISGFDFNPVADRLRLVGDNEQDFRINVDTGDVIVDGDLAFAAGDVNAGVNPTVTAAAYTNSFANTEATQLYDIDAVLDSLLLQNPPNDGTLQTIGDLGFDLDLLGGFDIVSASPDDNTAFVVSNASLYSLDLATGLATNLGMIGEDSEINFQGLASISDAPAAPAIAELLDLTGFDGEVTAELTLSREAAFDNILKFYETDAQGQVAGLKPGDSGYEDAVRTSLLEGVELMVGNLSTIEETIMLDGGAYYAPALLVDGNEHNLVTIDDAITGMGRIERDGNTWRFEDFTDFDFNDFVLSLDSTATASTPV